MFPFFFFVDYSYLCVRACVFVHLFNNARAWDRIGEINKETLEEFSKIVRIMTSLRKFAQSRLPDYFLQSSRMKHTKKDFDTQCDIFCQLIFSPSS